MKQTEINQLIIGLAGLREPLADKHTSRQLGNMCKAVIHEFVESDEAEELQNLLEMETGYQFTTSFDWIRFSRKSWTQHYDFDEKSNDIVSEFALALIKAAKQVRKEKVNALKHNIAGIMKEIIEGD